MISYKAAIEIIGQEFAKLKLNSEFVKLENASMRTLAEDVYSDINLPPFDNSAVDGIALNYDNSVKEWKIIGEISAGNFFEIDVDKHSAVGIMTGSRLPDSCNTVIPVEDLMITNDQAVLKAGTIVKKGMNIRKLGSDIKAVSYTHLRAHET